MFKGNSFNDFTEWLLMDKVVYKRIVALIEEIRRTPYHGTGRPEALKHQLNGMWSRRINLEHRLVYRVSDDSIEIISCRFHYTKD